MDKPLGEVMGGRVKKVIAAAARHITAWVYEGRRGGRARGELSSYELGVGIVGIPYLQAAAWRAIATFDLLRLPAETEEAGMALRIHMDLENDCRRF